MMLSTRLNHSCSLCCCGFPRDRYQLLLPLRAWGRSQFEACHDQNVISAYPQLAFDFIDCLDHVNALPRLREHRERWFRLSEHR